MERTIKIKIWKDLLKGNLKAILAIEPEFGYVNRSVRFDKKPDGIKVTVTNVFDEVKDIKEMILNFGEAWCFFEQAVYRAESVMAWMDKDTTVYEWNDKDEQ